MCRHPTAVHAQPVTNDEGPPGSSRRAFVVLRRTSDSVVAAQRDLVGVAQVVVVELVTVDRVVET